MCVLFFICFEIYSFSVRVVINFSFCVRVCMRLRCGKITKREVRKHVRRYVRRMVNPINNNGDQPSNSVGSGTVSATVTEPIPSTTSTTVMPSTTMTSTIPPEGTIVTPIPQSHPATPGPFMATDSRPFATSFTMPTPGREQPFGMPTTFMANLQNNPSTFGDNTASMFSPFMGLAQP